MNIKKSLWIFLLSLPLLAFGNRGPTVYHFYISKYGFLEYHQSVEGKATSNCSGRVKTCKTCPEKDFSIFATQYALINDNKIFRERSELHFEGFLTTSPNYQAVRWEGPFIHHSNNRFTLAIPFYDSTAGIWILDRWHDTERWIRLCY